MCPALLPARRHAAERLAVPVLELGLVDDVHHLAEVPAGCHEAERSARWGNKVALRDLNVRVSRGLQVLVGLLWSV